MKKIITFLFCIISIFTICTIPVFAEHTHTSLCYNNSTHEHTGNPIDGGGCYGAAISHTHTDACYITTCSHLAPVESTTEEYHIDDCGNSNCPLKSEDEEARFALDNNAMKCTYTCTICGASASYSFCIGCFTVLDGSVGIDIEHKNVSMDVAKSNPDIFLSCKKSNDGYSLNCGYETGKNYGELICSSKVMGIIAEQPIQQGSLNTNVIVTYADEHTDVKSASSDYDGGKKYSNGIVVLSYGGYTTEIIYSNEDNSDIVISDETINKEINVDNFIDIPMIDETTLDKIETDETTIIFVDETVITPRPTATPSPTPTITNTPNQEIGNDTNNTNSTNDTNDTNNVNNTNNIGNKSNHSIAIIIVITVIIICAICGVVVFIKKKK